MDFKVNANMGVKVKLTDVGVSILKAQHDELNQHFKSRGAKGLGEFKTNLDDNGYYQTQLWSLMHTFGPYISPTQENPFDLDIIISNGKPTEDFIRDFKKLLGMKEEL